MAAVAAVAENNKQTLILTWFSAFYGITLSYYSILSPLLTVWPCALCEEIWSEKDVSSDEGITNTKQIASFVWFANASMLKQQHLIFYAI